MPRQESHVKIDRTSEGTKATIETSTVTGFPWKKAAMYVGGAVATGALGYAGYYFIGKRKTRDGNRDNARSAAMTGNVNNPEGINGTDTGTVPHAGDSDSATSRNSGRSRSADLRVAA